MFEAFVDARAAVVAEGLGVDDPIAPRVAQRCALLGLVAEQLDLGRRVGALVVEPAQRAPAVEQLRQLRHRRVGRPGPQQHVQRRHRHGGAAVQGLQAGAVAVDLGVVAARAARVQLGFVDQRQRVRVAVVRGAAAHLADVHPRDGGATGQPGLQQVAHGHGVEAGVHAHRRVTHAASGSEASASSAASATRRGAIAKRPGLRFTTQRQARCVSRFHAADQASAAAAGGVPPPCA